MSESIDDLLNKIRQEADQLSHSSALDTLTAPSRQRLFAASTEVNWPDTSSEALNKLPLKAAYHCNELFQLDDEQFIRNLYTCLLRREPDSEGRQHYRERLAQGHSRFELLKSILESKEAQKLGTKVTGLTRFKCAYIAHILLPVPKLTRRLLHVLERTAQPRQAPFQNLIAAVQQLNNATQQSHHHLYQLLQGMQHEHESNRSRHRRNQVLISSIIGRTQTLLSRSEDNASSGNEHNAQPSTDAQKQACSDSCLDDFYVAFENAMRGTEQEIKTRQSTLLQYLPSPQVSPKRVLDIGCGRGEWLSLLNSKGYTACGVDTNNSMVEHCRRQGLTVESADALTWLQKQPDNSLLAVTAFHVVEHMPFDQLLAVTLAATQKLAPGGVLIYETPNAANVLVGSHSFYHDPTHRNPVTPLLLEFLAQYSGLSEVQLIGLHPHPPEACVPQTDELSKRFNHLFYGPQDILMVAQKPDLTSQPA